MFTRYGCQNGPQAAFPILSVVRPHIGDIENGRCCRTCASIKRFKRQRFRTVEWQKAWIREFGLEVQSLTTINSPVRMSPDTAASNHAFGETLRGSVVTPPGIESERGKVQGNNRNASACISCSSSSNSEFGYGHGGNCIKIPMQSAGRTSKVEHSHEERREGMETYWQPHLGGITQLNTFKHFRSLIETRQGDLRYRLGSKYQETQGLPVQSGLAFARDRRTTPFAVLDNGDTRALSGLSLTTDTLSYRWQSGDSRRGHILTKGFLQALTTKYLVAPF